ncbi:unnamed protein product [Cylicocyclus nassatus]|uniref:Uncharacterized protein n=1 Tax=Cylicocyclus nassatus TaxID=53992 RepID=A0AA36DS62_CYLNA|nr:unnamed protein product [Cylicocyclus nassatus]
MFLQLCVSSVILSFVVGTSEDQVPSSADAGDDSKFKIECPDDKLQGLLLGVTAGGMGMDRVLNTTTIIIILKPVKSVTFQFKCLTDQSKFEEEISILEVKKWDLVKPFTLPADENALTFFSKSNHPYPFGWYFGSGFNKSAQNAEELLCGVFTDPKDGNKVGACLAQPGKGSSAPSTDDGSSV